MDVNSNPYSEHELSVAMEIEKENDVFEFFAVIIFTQTFSYHNLHLIYIILKSVLGDSI